MGLFDLAQSEHTTHDDYVPPEPPVLDGIRDIEIDVETNGLKWWKGDRIIGIGGCRPDGSTFYLPVGHRQGRNLDEDTVRRWAHTELKHKHITNVSTKFDIHHMRAWGVDLEEQGNTVADIAFDAALLDDHRDEFSLESLCRDFLPDDLKVTEVGGMQLDPKRMADYSSGAVAVRCEADVRQVHRLKPILGKRIRDEHLERVQSVENECIFPVCEMEKNSVHLDVELLHQWSKEAERRVNNGLLEVSREVGFSCNPDATKDWVRLFEKLHLPIVKTMSVRKKDGTEELVETPTFTDEVLAAVDHPIVQRLRHIGKLQSLRSKYLTNYSQAVESDGRLHYHLHQLRSDDVGTVTGRFSSSEVNIQQVTKTKKQIASFGTDEFLIRRLFLPGPGHLFFSADAKQIEYRIFAHYANSLRINRAFAENPQLNFHQLIFEMLKPYAKHLTYEHVKNINFMRIYGGGIVKLALMMGMISQATADRLEKERSEWFRARKRGRPPQPELDPVMEIDEVYNRELPEVKPLLDKSKRLAEERGFVRTMLGRRGRFVTPQQKRFSYKAFNFVGQGGGADYMKVKLIELHKVRKVTGFLMRATVHDQVIGDVPDERCAEVTRAFLDRQSFNLRVPILWDAKTGKNWKDCD